MTTTFASRFALLWLMALLLTGTLPAQPNTSGGAPARAEGMQLGTYGAVQIVQHNADFKSLPTVPCCSPGFSDGDGIGYAEGVLFQMPLADRFALQLRLGYSTLQGELLTREAIGNVISNGQTVTAISEHSIDASFNVLGFEPRIAYYPFSVPLWVQLGLQAGAIATTNYTQSETLVEPQNVTFAGGETVRGTSSGAIPDPASLYLAGLAGIGYDIPLTDRVTLTPEIAYHLGFTDVMKDSSWKISALRLGLAAKYRFGESSSSSKSGINASVSAAGLLADSSEQPIVQLQVEEFLTAQLRPLLNYVFFDENSGTLPARYTRLTPQTAQPFTVDGLHYVDVIPTYHHLLNIVGRRMRENSSATLRLVGCNANVRGETGNQNLSRTRAETVRDYLRDIWGIDQSRISIEARDLPETPSNINEPDGVEENRRVELYASDPKILDPVFTNDTTRTANPPGVRFRPSGGAEAGIAEWRLKVSQEGVLVKEFGGTGSIPPQVDWNIAADQGRVPRAPVPLDYALTVTDRNGESYTSPSESIPVEQVTIQRKRRERIADKEVSRYSLILFDYGKADISEANRRIVNFIKGRITLNSDVVITGHTDRLGEESFNQNLSQERADAVKRALDARDARARGLGESPLLYDNRLPEGRFYCRVVNVVVETPVSD